MILQQIGLLKVESNLNRFQRRLESPLPPSKACHSSEGWNLSHYLLFSESENLSILPLSICHPIAIGSRENWNLSHYLLFSESENLSILPLSICHPIAIGFSEAENHPNLK
jgi:putative effector of murein hydrolase